MMSAEFLLNLLFRFGVLLVYALCDRGRDSHRTVGAFVHGLGSIQKHHAINIVEHAADGIAADMPQLRQFIGRVVLLAHQEGGHFQMQV